MRKQTLTAQDRKTVIDAHKALKRSRSLGMPGCKFNKETAATFRKLGQLVRKLKARQAREEWEIAPPGAMDESY